jgi:streptogramin lyase
MSLGAAVVLVVASFATPAGAVTVRTFQSGITPGSQPTRIAAGVDGNLYFTENAVHKIGRITSGGAITEFTAAFPSGSPFGITNGADGAIYYTVDGSGIARFPTGSHATSPNGLEEITAGADGLLWFTENAGNKLHRSNGATDDQFTPFAAASGPSGIAATLGQLWVTESTASKVARVGLDGNLSSEVTLTPGTGPAGIASGPDGNLWVAEKTAGRIARISGDGSFMEFPVLPAGSNSQPTSIVAGPDGNLWFTEANASRIGRITTSGVVTEFPAGAQPRGITVGQDGNLWFAGGSGYIGRVSISAPPRYTNPDAITVAASPNSDGPGDPYPSTIEASGLSGTVSKVSVRLNGIYHPNADDLEALLVGPGGQKVLLMSDSAGGGSRDPATGQMITFDDDGPHAPAKLVSGIFKPFVGDPGPPTFAGPAPAPPYATSLSAFDGTNPNGVWKLFLQDDNAVFDRGVIAGGWSLDIELTPPPVSVPGPQVQVPVPGPTITVTGPPRVVSPPADTTAPRLTLGTVATRLAQAAFRKGVAVRVTPSEAVTLDVTLSVKPRRATLAVADQLVLFDRSFSANRATTLAVKPSARRLGRPKKAFRAVLRIVATDGGGNRAVATRTITVQPDKKKRR